MKKILFGLAILFAVSCNDKISELTQARVQELIENLPDHESGFNRDCFSNEFSEILSKGFEFANANREQGMLDADFMYYWFNGNGEQLTFGSWKGSIPENSNTGQALVNAELFSTDGESMGSYDISLVFEDGKWVIDDFNGKKDQINSTLELFN